MPRHRNRNDRLRLIYVVLFAALIAVAVYAIISIFTSSGGVNASALATADLGHAVSQLAGDGFGGSDKLTNGGSVAAADCVKNSTGAAKQFLAKNQCQEYSAASVKVHKRGMATSAVVSWATFSSSALAAKYQQLTGENHGSACFASGTDGAAAWVARVQPTGHIAADREVLQAVSPVKLSADYLAFNCAG